MNPTTETKQKINLLSPAQFKLLTELRSTVLTERQITLKVIDLLKEAG